MGDLIEELRDWRSGVELVTHVNHTLATRVRYERGREPGRYPMIAIAPAWPWQRRRLRVERGVPSRSARPRTGDETSPGHGGAGRRSRRPFWTIRPGALLCPS